MTDEKVKLWSLNPNHEGKAAFITLPQTSNNMAAPNPWNYNEVDRMEAPEIDDFKAMIKACRFFYKHDPIASSVINKTVEIAITNIQFTKNKLSENEIRIFESLKDSLQEFAENMALEYLLSGLVVPEVKFERVNKNFLMQHGIKKYNVLMLPTTLWLRDPATIKIYAPIFSDKPSYYLKVPENLVYFIMNGGVYSDGRKDTALYQKLNALYPGFVEAIKQGTTEFPIENPEIVIRRKYLTNSPYPVPYLSAAIEPLKHKRNLRRMDYSIASRVIGAIQLIKLGNDTYPITEDDDEQFDAIRSQMYWRDNVGNDIERIFQLFANHTLSIEWVYPPTQDLLNDAKYKDINQDIIFALGFPRSLITGEAEKSGTSDSEISLLAPVNSMENMRAKILRVIRYIVDQVTLQNNLKESPEVTFEPINLQKFSDFILGLQSLFNSGGISRDSLAKYFGYNWRDEAEKLSEENKTMQELEIGAFSPKPEVQTENLTTENNKTPQNNLENVVKQGKKQ